MFVIPDGLYCGPINILERFRAGEIVTKTDCLTDESLWTVELTDPAAGARLQWMLNNLERDDHGRIVRCRG
ncbi:secretory carrier-associated membrane protein [Mycolicibacterium canariasense]|uniref:Secretory carrier-associated membrane protein n=2 Tax=Mycolicibacterium canariasense TaxID=228230 RepID=A0A100WA73_MYCCR|nr:secretory carrier-associated membrane protein [Mycolicibacterium canariasense]